jgi:hypothetical protein
METLKFYIYKVNNEKEQINFALDLELEIDIQINKAVIKSERGERDQTLVTNFVIDDNSFDWAIDKINEENLGTWPVVVFSKFREKSYLNSVICFHEAEEFNPEEFLNLLVDNFIVEFTRQ